MADRSAPEPNGEEKKLEHNDIFFSTTDQKGVIELSNAVFARLSKYGHETLVGSPHNIIRHPVMPGGAFHLVWGELLEGRPAVAYVHNMDAEGTTYTVLSTLLPVGDKLLSVRVPPACPDRLAVADSLYARASEIEKKAREGGASRAEAAKMGAESLGGDLAGVGIPSFADYVIDLLPAEVAARVSLGDALPVREGAEGPVGVILDATQRIHASTEILVGRLDELAELSANLVASAEEIHPTVAELQGRALRAADISEMNKEEYPALASIAASMKSRAVSASEVEAELAKLLSVAAARARSLRFRIALVRLHNIMVGHFAAEILDGSAAPAVGESIQLLCQALAEGVAGATEELATTRSELLSVRDKVGEATRYLSGFRRQRGKWVAEVPETSDGELTETAHELREEDEVDPVLDRLGAVAAQGGNLYIPLDREELEHQVGRIKEAAAQVE